VGEQKFEQSFTIEPNPAKGFTEAKMGQLYEQSMRLFRLHEKLAVLVDSLDKSIASVSAIAQKSTADQQKFNSLDSLRKEIIETNRKTVFFDEFKFRRRLSDVYLSLLFGIEPLSPSRIGAIDVLEDEYKKIEKTFYTILK
jgi:hypothetical protein